MKWNWKIQKEKRSMSKNEILNKIEQLDAIFTKNINYIHEILNGRAKK